MNFTFLSSYLALDILGCFSNFSTLIYIFKSFDIGTHVFTLIFLDSLISTLCSAISTVSDILFFAGHFNPTCQIAFLATYLPGSYGAVLTFLISNIRFYLANKAAKNIHPSNKKVLSYALGLFALIAAFFLAYFVIFLIMDIPLSLFSEICLNPDQEPRTFPRSTRFVLNSPNIFNICSLMTDLRMLRFLKRTILSTDILPMSTRHEGDYATDLWKFIIVTCFTLIKFIFINLLKSIIFFLFTFFLLVSMYFCLLEYIIYIKQ